MGRSVMTVPDAVCVVYLHHDNKTEWGWDEYVEEEIQNPIKNKYPSFVAVDSWDGREGKRILENELARVVVCEYCGMVSINLAIRTRLDHYTPDLTSLAEHWCQQISHGFQQLFLDRLRRIATMSNGVSICEKANP